MYKIFSAFVCLITCCSASSYALADMTGEFHEHSADYAPEVNITETAREIIIHANGIPDHEHGSFPNRHNPHGITAQEYTFKIQKFPAVRSEVLPFDRKYYFGIALNGVPFDPASSECFGAKRDDPPADQNCKWHVEGIIDGRSVNFGLDESFGHVKSYGAYHYHGKPMGFLKKFEDDEYQHVGYAADGYKIYAALDDEFKPSYALRSGRRHIGPSGNYDGTYKEDFIYTADSGELDECNGRIYNDEYVYFITGSFPYIPRCWRGKPDDSFIKGKGLYFDENQNFIFDEKP